MSSMCCLACDSGQVDPISAPAGLRFNFYRLLYV